MKKQIIALLAFLALSSPGQAAPSAAGSTGMLNTPTADILRQGQFHLGYYHVDEGDETVFGVNLADNFELSLAAFKEKNASYETSFNLKYMIKPENIMTPGIAVGMEDMFGKRDRTAYIAFSKALPFGLRLHAGYGNGRYDGVFYAVEKQLVSSAAAGVFPDTSLIVEYDGKNANYGVRMSLASGVKLNAGWRDDTTYMGLTYNFY